MHAQAIADNISLREVLAAHIAAGKPVWAECGGMMALFDTLVTTDGARHAHGACCPVRSPCTSVRRPWVRSNSSAKRHPCAVTLSITPPPAPRCRPPPARPNRTTIRCPMPARRFGSTVLSVASDFHAWFPSCPAAVVELMTAPDGVKA